MKIAILINYKDVGKKASGKKHFAAGSVEHEPFTNIDQLGNIIASVADEPKECIAIGTFEGDGKVTFKNDKHYSRRAKDMLPGNIMVIDNDTEMPYDVNIFCKYWDTFKDAGYVQSKSGSTLAGSKEHGSHTYFMYKGSDLKKAMLFLEAICIIEGYYVVDFHKTGRAVVKTPVDVKLNEVQMPVYEDDTDPVVVDGVFIDIDTYPDNYDHLMDKAEKIAADLLKDAQEESIQRHKVYLEEYQGVTKLNSQELLISLNDYDSHEIDEDVVLYSEGAEVGTVGDLLLGKVKTRLFADIHEPDYGDGAQKAKFYGSMFHSQAHGGIKYYIKVSYSWYQENKDKLLHDVSVKKKELNDMVHPEMSDEEIAEVLDQTDSAVEKNNVTKHIKKVTGLTVNDIKEAYNRSLVKDEFSLSKYFKGASIFWDGNLGVFVEYHKRGDIRLHKKVNFTQTLMSKLGMPFKDIQDILPQIPLRYMEYVPTNDGNSSSEHINVWRGVRFPGTSDKIPPTISKLLRNLFIDDYKAKEVFINWMATILQTGIRTGIAWGFFGEQGTGKGIICDVMRDLVGRRNSSMNVSDVQLQSSFNGYAKHVQFIHLNEVASDFHGRHGVAGKLKALITDSALQINEKGINEIEVENFANIILNSNKPNPIELDVGDRRWNMINTTKPLTKCSWFKGQKTVDKIMGAELKEFGSYLMNYEIDQHLAKIPMELSASKKAISDQTTSPYKLLGDAIKNSDFDTLCDLLNPEDSMTILDIDEIETAMSEKFWSADLLKRMYCTMSGKTDVGSRIPANHLIKPYITKRPSEVVKIRGSNLRGYKT